MNVIEKLEQRWSMPVRRTYCPGCLRPELTCYCARLKIIDPKIRFAILIHGREAQKRIATGRLAHRCLTGSYLLPGYDYSHDAKVNALIKDPRYHCVVLYPGTGSLNLSATTEHQRSALTPPGKELLVFVVDGTWITARKTMQRSANLRDLPRICFEPSAPSRFRVRKQPRQECYSTIEAIHQTIELLGDANGFDTKCRGHDSLLSIFDSIVEQQLELSASRKRHHRASH